jgi:hypothetical protein
MPSGGRLPPVSSSFPINSPSTNITPAFSSSFGFPSSANMGYSGQGGANTPSSNAAASTSKHGSAVD